MNVNIFTFIAGYLPNPKTSRCELIRDPMCRKFSLRGYNLTLFPNSLRHRSALEASYEMKLYKPLIEVGCSSDLSFFLCSVYFPYCLPEGPHDFLLPCKSLCESVRDGCNNLMVSHGFQWPFDCNQYPNETGGMCIGTSVRKR